MKKFIVLCLAAICSFAVLFGCSIEFSSDAEQVTVTFTAEETEYPAVTVEKGSTVDKPADPDGYVVRWYKDSAFTEAFIFGEDVVNENITLYGKKIRLFNVTFNADGTEKTVTVEDGALVEKPVDPEKDGYKFISWNLADGTAFDFTAPVTSDITLNALFKEAFKVRFDTSSSDDGLVIPAQIVVKGECAVEPEDVISRGDQYDFDFWADENGERYDFSVGVTSDIVLQPEWKHYYLVNYRWADGYNTLIAAKKVYDGGKAEDWRTTQGLQYATTAYYWWTANVESPFVGNSGDLEKLYEFDEVLTSNIDLYTYQQLRTSWAFPEEAVYDKTNPFKVETSGQAFDGSLTYGDDHMRFTVPADETLAHPIQLEFSQMSLPYSAATKYLNLKYKNYGKDAIIRMTCWYTAEGGALTPAAAAYSGLVTDMTEDSDWATIELLMPLSKGQTLVFLRLEFLSDNALAFDSDGTDILLHSAKFEATKENVIETTLWNEDLGNTLTAETAGAELEGSLSFKDGYASFVVNEGATHVNQLQLPRLDLVYDSAAMSSLKVVYKNYGADTICRVFVYGIKAGTADLVPFGAAVGTLDCNMTEEDEWSVMTVAMPAGIGTGDVLIFVRLELVADNALPFDSDGTQIDIASVSIVE